MKNTGAAKSLENLKDRGMKFGVSQDGNNSVISPFDEGGSLNRSCVAETISGKGTRSIRVQVDLKALCRSFDRKLRVTGHTRLFGWIRCQKGDFGPLQLQTRAAPATSEAFCERVSESCANPSFVKILSDLRLGGKQLGTPCPIMQPAFQDG